MGPAHRVKTCEDVSFEFVQLFVFFSCQSLLCKILTSKSNNCTGLRLQKLSESNFQSFVVQVKFAKMLAVICNLCCNGYCNLWYYGYIVDLVLCTSLSDDPLARDDTRRGVFSGNQKRDKLKGGTFPYKAVLGGHPPIINRPHIVRMSSQKLHFAIVETFSTLWIRP